MLVMEDLQVVLVVGLVQELLLEQEVLVEPPALVVMGVLTLRLHSGYQVEAEELVKQEILMEVDMVEMVFHTVFLEQSIIGAVAAAVLLDILVWYMLVLAATAAAEEDLLKDLVVFQMLMQELVDRV